LIELYVATTERSTAHENSTFEVRERMQVERTMRTLDYYDIVNGWDMSVCLFFLKHSDKVKKLIKKPKGVKLAHIKDEVYNRLNRVIFQRCGIFRTKCSLRRPLEIMAINVLNAQVWIIRRFFPGVSLPTMALRDDRAFHHELVALFSLVDRLQKHVISQQLLSNISDTPTLKQSLPPIKIPHQLPPLDNPRHQPTSTPITAVDMCILPTL
jgi:hypothetical protein